MYKCLFLLCPLSVALFMVFFAMQNYLVFTPSFIHLLCYSSAFAILGKGFRVLQLIFSFSHFPLYFYCLIRLEFILGKE